ncbi:MAG: PLP-dependent transferase [Thermovirgaceae bacterium]|nr:PLP-dependent transferase [Thermovirgaceae bacterium]
MNDRSAGIDAVHSGDRVIEGITKPKVPPIYASSVYAFETLADLDSVFDGEKPGYVYARMGHPNADLLEQTVAALGGCPVLRSGEGKGLHPSLWQG